MWMSANTYKYNLFDIQISRWKNYLQNVFENPMDSKQNVIDISSIKSESHQPYSPKDMSTAAEYEKKK